MVAMAPQYVSLIRQSSPSNLDRSQLLLEYSPYSPEHVFILILAMLLEWILVIDYCSAVVLSLEPHQTMKLSFTDFVWVFVRDHPLSIS